MARDRLAAIRAQQNTQGGGGGGGRDRDDRYDEPSYPQPARQNSSRDDYSYGQERGYGRGGYEEEEEEEEPNYRQQGRGYDRGQQMAPPPQARLPPQPSSSSRNNNNAGVGLPSGPRGGGGAPRRPNNPPAINNTSQQDVYTRPSQANYGRGGGGSNEPRDFDPNAAASEPPRDFNPNQNQTQYVPGPPAVTRQRSISGGRGQRGAGGGGSGGSSSRPIYQPPPQGQGQQLAQSSNSDYYNNPNNLSVSRGQPSLSRSGRSAAPPYEDEGNYGGGGAGGAGPGGYEYSDKGSTVNLVERGEEEGYEMQRRGNNEPRSKSTVVGSGPGATKKGGKTIKKGEVPMEEMSEFFAEISDLQQALREANNSIQQVQALHMRILSLPSADDPQSIALTANLKTLSSSTRSFFSSIKNRLQILEQGNANLRALIPLNQSEFGLSLSDVNVRQTQVEALKERFKEAIQRYAEVERDSRAKNRSRMERQVKIVNPGLSANEVANVVKQAEEGGNNALFSQAVLQSNGQRSYAARGALREVESRAAELARIEQTLIELAQLFNDMAMMVEAQDVQIVEIEATAVNVESDMDKGLQDTKKAVVSARSARKWRWVCFGIIVVILIIVAIIVVVEVVIPLINKKNSTSTKTTAQADTTSSSVKPLSAASSTHASSTSATASTAGVFSQSSIQANVAITSASTTSSSSTNWWDSTTSSSSTDYWDSYSSSSSSSSENWDSSTTYYAPPTTSSTDYYNDAPSSSSSSYSYSAPSDSSSSSSSSYNNYAVTINTQSIASNAQYVSGSGNGGFLPTATAAMAKGRHRRMMKRMAA